MANYRRPQVNLSTRINLAGALLNPELRRGEITELAQRHQVSRKFLYHLQSQAETALALGLEARQPGPHRDTQTLRVDKAYLQQAVLILSLLPPSLRNLQTALEWLFGARVSLGNIQHILRQAGTHARAENQRLHPVQPMQAELDEIFQTGRPCLTVIDHQSALLLHLGQAADCDLVTWGVTLLDLQQHGVQFDDLASDGSSSIQGGIRAAQPDPPYRPDWFHLLQPGHEITGRLEQQAYAALADAEKAQRAEQEAQRGKRRAGRPLKSALSSAQAALIADQVCYQSDAWSWLFRELRQAFQLCQPSGRLVDIGALPQTLAAILDLMLSLPIPAVSIFATHLQKLSQAILAPFLALAQALAPWRSQLPAELEAFLLLAWSQRDRFPFQIQRDLPPVLQPVAQAVWDALSQFHRTSCMAECVHSWVRPFLELHRGMPDWLLPLLQGFWNHHVFQRGTRRGFSPLALAKIPAVSDPLTWLQQLAAPSL
jgi:hypothetical protein